MKTIITFVLLLGFSSIDSHAKINANKAGFVGIGTTNNVMAGKQSAVYHSVRANFGTPTNVVKKIEGKGYKLECDCSTRTMTGEASSDWSDAELAKLCANACATNTN